MYAPKEQRPENNGPQHKHRDEQIFSSPKFDYRHRFDHEVEEQEADAFADDFVNGKNPELPGPKAGIKEEIQPKLEDDADEEDTGSMVMAKGKGTGGAPPESGTPFNFPNVFRQKEPGKIITGIPGSRYEEDADRLITKIRADQEAASMAESIHARAFTKGDTIYFNSGEYQPETREGQWLIAHEMAHVAQGGEGVKRKEKDNFGPETSKRSDYTNYRSVVDTHPFYGKAWRLDMDLDMDQNFLETTLFIINRGNSALLILQNNGPDWNNTGHAAEATTAVYYGASYSIPDNVFYSDVLFSFKADPGQRKVMITAKSMTTGIQLFAPVYLRHKTVAQNRGQKHVFGYGLAGEGPEGDFYVDYYPLHAGIKLSEPQQNAPATKVSPVSAVPGMTRLMPELQKGRYQLSFDTHPFGDRITLYFYDADQSQDESWWTEAYRNAISGSKEDGQYVWVHVGLQAPEAEYGKSEAPIQMPGGMLLRVNEAFSELSFYQLEGAGRGINLNVGGSKFGQLSFTYNYLEKHQEDISKRRNLEVRFAYNDADGQAQELVSEAGVSPFGVGLEIGQNYDAEGNGLMLNEAAEMLSDAEHLGAPEAEARMNADIDHAVADAFKSGLIPPGLYQDWVNYRLFRYNLAGLYALYHSDNEKESQQAQELISAGTRVLSELEISFRKYLQESTEDSHKSLHIRSLFSLSYSASYEQGENIGSYDGQIREALASAPNEKAWVGMLHSHDNISELLLNIAQAARVHDLNYLGSTETQSEASAVGTQEIQGRLEQMVRQATGISDEDRDARLSEIGSTISEVLGTKNLYRKFRETYASSLAGGSVPVAVDAAFVPEQEFLAYAGVNVVKVPLYYWQDAGGTWHMVSLYSKNKDIFHATSNTAQSAAEKAAGAPPADLFLELNDSDHLPSGRLMYRDQDGVLQSVVLDEPWELADYLRLAAIVLMAIGGLIFLVASGGTLLTFTPAVAGTMQGLFMASAVVTGLAAASEWADHAHEGHLDTSTMVWDVLDIASAMIPAARFIGFFKVATGAKQLRDIGAAGRRAYLAFEVGEYAVEGAGFVAGAYETIAGIYDMLDSDMPLSQKILMIGSSLGFLAGQGMMSVGFGKNGEPADKSIRKGELFGPAEGPPQHFNSRTRHMDAPDEDLASTAWHHADTPDADGAPVRARFEPDEQLDPPRRNTREGEADDWLEAHPKEKKRMHEEAEYEMNKRENLAEGLDEATMQQKFSALLRAKGILAMDNEIGLDVMAVLASLQPIAAAHGAVKEFDAEGSTVWMIGSKEKVGKVKRLGKTNQSSNRQNDPSGVNWELIRNYIHDLEANTDFKIHPKQIEKLKEALRKREYTLLPTNEVKRNRRHFNQKRDDLILEWERQTGQTWPVHDKPYISRSGAVYIKKGEKYQAHHIIENKYGGDAEWWNITPARFPDQHQGGVHRAGSPSRELFK